MTPELTRLLAILAAVIVVVVLVVYWWTQRDPSAEKASDAPLPLFGGIQPGERFTPPQSRPAISDDASDRMPPVVPFRAPRTPPGSMPVIKTVITPTDSPAVAPPRTEPPRTEPPRTEPPRTEPPAAEPVAGFDATAVGRGPSKATYVSPRPRRDPPPSREEPPKAPPVIREFNTVPAAPA
ncbi:MAG: hypothetical protein K2R93_20510, partial [Gemmatimonadaceae bacterium]|nr:hypothetical protein [Gemmatimonadaceae bacterium]